MHSLLKVKQECVVNDLTTRLLSVCHNLCGCVVLGRGGISDFDLMCFYVNLYMAV